MRPAGRSTCGWRDPEGTGGLETRGLEVPVGGEAADGGNIL